jgi:hypothetical protein
MCIRMNVVNRVHLLSAAAGEQHKSIVLVQPMMALICAVLFCQRTIQLGKLVAPGAQRLSLNLEWATGSTSVLQDKERDQHVMIVRCFVARELTPASQVLSCRTN